jgi:DNA-binding winged helix-turn-helix (wHTH) protein/cytochrome c-type biogenesis protein CcmH/NrfG
VGTVYSFGPFELDTTARRLRRGGEVVALPDRHVDVLATLVAHAGTVVSKDALIEAAWRGVAVTDNSLEQAVSALRRALAHESDDPCIQTVPRQGYRFSATVSRRAARETDAVLDDLLAPHRAWLEGRAALETLGREQASLARRAFERVLAVSPDHAEVHIGLANACAFEFEGTRADATPDVAALVAAVQHAREACRLNPESAEAWATLGFVLHLTRDGQHAVAAARRAVSLEPDNWRHHLRLAVVSWGEERLRAAQRCLGLLPGLALAHWLAATVHVARQALDRAEQELDRGAQAQDAQTPQARFSAVGLHWLRGLVRLARGDEAGALQDFQRELAFEATGQLYARECCANTWYAIGAVALCAGRRDEAVLAFTQTLDRIPGHIMAMAGLVSARGHEPGSRVEERADDLSGLGFVTEAAMGRAALLGVAEPGRAAHLVDAALDAMPSGSAGWTLPIEPLLRVTAHPAWQGVLARLRSRAA